ncbi:MAG: class I SAM-dependent methyltransferase [Spirochaetales bacterium]|nr:class I SAM-dependent methyltransferase [Spirochaetales bacterium]
MASTWISYNELAWTEDLLADPAEYEDEVKVYVDVIKDTAEKPPRTLLHLGSGAGGQDHVFKRHFIVTGVDLSSGMLNKARKAHPDIEYLEGDMRTIRLNRQFDAVVIPDGIDYMVSIDDLRQAIQTAVIHLNPGGVLLVVGKTEETFQNNNFAYTGEKDDVHVTLFENNYINPYVPHTYEITLFYLIRQQGKLTTYTEHSIAGLFPHAIWDKIFKDAGLTMQEKNLNGIYDNYLLGDGEYPMTIFIGRKV